MLPPCCLLLWGREGSPSCFVVENKRRREKRISTMPILPINFEESDAFKDKFL
jgi:hypothetical protein